MTPERWARIAPLIDAALELDTDERLPYVEAVSEGDQELRADLLRLLSKTDRGASLLDRAAAERFALLQAEAQMQLPRTIGDRFVVEREIGRGGMATVVLARDKKHDRPVALKILRRDVAASIGAERFLREIQTAARLQHPHVMPLHDSGEADGFVYYVMPFAPGETLRERLVREQQLPLADALHIGRDVAAALDHAHRNEIVHRDIKPENIFLSAGHALVMDFGIARALSGADEETIAVPGLAIGTPAYMSPEQATAGQQVDGRTDVYALGCVVYEMLAGHPPFMGTTSREVLARHSLDAVPPLRLRRPQIPESMARAVEKALAKAPADRFRTATEFVDACEKSSSATAPAARHRWVIPAAIIAAILVAGVATTRFLSPSKRVTSTPSEKTAPTIAVLPFRNIGSDSSNEALSDGISEEIAGTIGKIPGLNVRAPRSSFSLKGTKLTVPQIGSALGVNYLVDGTLQKDAGRLRVRVALLAAANDSTLWTTEYDRPAGDVFAIQDEIARLIASALRVQLTPAAVNIARRATESAPAHELYLRGRYFFQRRDSTSLRKAREYFELAIARDSSYALAYTGLSDAISHASVFGYVPAHSSMPLAKRYVERALALDSTLSEAHTSRAFIATFYEWDWNTAGAEFEKALSLDSHYPSAHLWRAWYLLATDSLDDSIREARLALDLEPFLVLTNTRLISLLYYAGRFNEALEQSQKTFELDSTFFQLAAERARVMVALQQCERALVTLSRVPDQTPAMLQGTRGYIYAQCGRPEQALGELKHLLGESRAGKNVSHYSLAVIQAGLGNKNAAFAELNAAYTERAWTMFLLKTEPAFADLRGDPRFLELVKMVRPSA